MSERYVDADGHVMENLQDMSEFLDPTFAAPEPTGCSRAWIHSTRRDPQRRAP